MMVTSYLERLGLLCIVVKAFMFLYWTMYAKSGYEDSFDKSAQFMLGIALGALFTTVLDQVGNFYFYKQLVKAWDTHICEDIEEELSDSSGLCGWNGLARIKYLNFLEFMSLWKAKGWIIPNEAVRD